MKIEKYAVLQKAGELRVAVIEAWEYANGTDHKKSPRQKEEEVNAAMRNITAGIKPQWVTRFENEVLAPEKALSAQTMKAIYH